MYQFDAYINSILKDINVGKKQKYEMAEEFNDHLEGLKQEYIDKGITEDEAIVKAIEDFGNGKELSKRLNHSFLNYRTKSNILFGIGYVIFIILIYKIVNNISSISVGIVIEPLKVIKYISIMVISFIIIMSPISYFLPVIFRKVTKLSQISLINILLINFILAFNLYKSWFALDLVPHTTFIFVVILAFISYLIVALFSGILGFKLLNIVNNKSCELKRLVSK